MNDWNDDRMKSAHAQINCALVDMMTVALRGECSQNIRDRIVMMLRDAAEQIFIMQTK